MVENRRVEWLGPQVSPLGQEFLLLSRGLTGGLLLVLQLRLALSRSRREQGVLPFEVPEAHLLSVPRERKGTAVTGFSRFNLVWEAACRVTGWLGKQ